MSPIIELIKAVPNEGYTHLTIAAIAEEALPDLKKLVRGIKKLPHGPGCERPPNCCCGLSEIQSLLGE